MRKTWGVVLAVGTWACGGSDPPASADTTSADTTTSGTGTSATTETTTTESTGAADESSTGDPVEPPPACGSLDYAWHGLLAGPGEPEYDDALATAVLRHERVHVGLTTLPSGLATDIQIAAADETARAAVDAFVAGEGWDFEADSGIAPFIYCLWVA